MVHRPTAAIIVVVVFITLAVPPVNPLPLFLSQPVSQPACADAPEPELAFRWTHQLENLAFDESGNLVVMDWVSNQAIWLDAEGLRGIQPIPSTHGIVFNPADDTFYATGLLAGGQGPAGVVAFQLGEDFGPLRQYAEALPAANGMAFGPDGALYASSPLASGPPYLVRIEPGGGTGAAWQDRYGPNGLWPADGGLYAAITGDQSSPIVHIPFDGSPERTVAYLSTGAGTLQPGVHAAAGPKNPALVPKGLDDITMGPDGYLYVAAHLSGEVIRVDPADGSACVLAAGLHEPTSVRFAPPAWGEHAGDLYVTDMGGIGVTALVGPGEGSLWRLDVG